MNSIGWILWKRPGYDDFTNYYCRALTELVKLDVEFDKFKGTKNEQGRFVAAVLNKNIIAILFVSLILSFLVIVITWIFSAPILWILGSNYSTLNKELVLSIIGSCIYLILGFFYAINLSRGFHNRRCRRWCYRSRRYWSCIWCYRSV